MAMQGSIEQAMIAASQTGGSAIWSSWFGPPVPHHYLVGFILIGVGWIIYFRRGRSAEALDPRTISFCSLCGVKTTEDAAYCRECGNKHHHMTCTS